MKLSNQQTLYIKRIYTLNFLLHTTDILSVWFADVLKICASCVSAEKQNLVYYNSKTNKMDQWIFLAFKKKKKVAFTFCSGRTPSRSSINLSTKAWIHEQLMIQLLKLKGRWTNACWKGAREHSFAEETKFEQTSTKMFFKTKSARSSSKTFVFGRFQLQQCPTDLL